MEYMRGPARPQSRRAAFKLLRVIVHLLRASGIPERALRSMSERFYRQYARTPARGIWLDCARFLQLAQALGVWARDPEFIDETGSPMRLRCAGGLHPGPGSFPYLLKKAGVAIGARSALAQLQAFGSIRRCDRGQRVRLVSDVLRGVMGDRFLAGPMLDSIRRCAETVEYNVCGKPAAADGLMHRWTGCAALDARRLDEVQRFVRSNGQQFLDAVGEKFHSCAGRAARKRLCYGVGLYVYVDRAGKLSGRASRERCASA